MKRVLSFILVFALVMVSFIPVQVEGVSGSTAGWYLVNEKYNPIEKDGEEYSTSGLSGYVDYHGGSYEKDGSENSATIYNYRKNVNSGNFVFELTDYINWTDPLSYYAGGDIPSIKLTRSCQPSDENEASHIVAIYTKSSSDSYGHDEDFYNEAGDEYIFNMTTVMDLSETSGYAGVDSGLMEGSVDNVNQLEIRVDFKTGNAEYAYSYSYYYEWYESGPFIPEIIKEEVVNMGMGWYLVDEKYDPIEKDGEEYSTSGLSGYVDYHGGSYEKDGSENSATIYNYRKNVNSGNFVFELTDYINWTDPLSYYAGGDIPSIKLTRSCQPSDENEASHIVAIYTKSSSDSYGHDEDFYNEAGDEYIFNMTTVMDLSETSGYAGVDSGLMEGSVDNVNQLEIRVDFKTGNAEYAYSYSYYYEWMDTGISSDMNSDAEISSTSIFSDFAESHWAYGYVKHMMELGIIEGYDDGTFRPDASFNRGAFAKLLALSFELGSYTGNVDIYSDLTNSHWAYGYAMVSQNYMTFYETNGIKYFMPENDAEREDVAVAMIKAMNIDIINADLSYLDNFTDKMEISEDLRPYIALAVEYGVMNGTSSNTFSPKKALTRAEASTLFARYLMEIKGTVNVDSMKKTTN